MKSICRLCQTINEQKKRKVLSPQAIENIQNTEDGNLSMLRDIKNHFQQCVQESEADVVVLTFELQRPLELPLLSLDESYDIRHLWFSNVCIYNELYKKAHMYVWDESIAKRGSEEIASCIYKHLVKALPKTTKKVIFYSDSIDLYRNLNVTLMLRKFFDYYNNDLVTIEQRFFYSGHSANDCNRCFETINKQIKTKNTEFGIFVPNDWVKLISSAKKSDPKFDVISMTENDFYSVKKLESIVGNAKIPANEIKINWSNNLKSIICNRSEPITLRINYFNQETEEIMNLLNENNINDFRTSRFAYSSKGGNAINKSKFDDLQSA